MFAVRFKLWIFVGVFAFGTWRLQAELFLVNATNTFPSTHVISLAWDPSPDPKAVGYFLCWGLSDGQCTNRFNVLNTTSATISGFETNVVYHFSVIAYDAFGQESPPSNEAQYVLSSPPPVDGPTLTIAKPIILPGAVVVPFDFQGTAGRTYELQATLDFDHWDTIWSTNCVASGPVTFRITSGLNYSRRFFRLQME